MLDTYINGALVNEHVNVRGDHYKLIRETGAVSTVLLKNVNSTLPLDFGEFKNLAILGSHAGPNLDGPNGCADRGCDQGTLAIGWGSGTANFPYLITSSAAIQGYVPQKYPDMVVQSIYFTTRVCPQTRQCK